MWFGSWYIVIVVIDLTSRLRSRESIEDYKKGSLREIMTISYRSRSRGRSRSRSHTRAPSLK